MVVVEALNCCRAVLLSRVLVIRMEGRADFVLEGRANFGPVGTVLGYVGLEGFALVGNVLEGIGQGQLPVDCTLPSGGLLFHL